MTITGLSRVTVTGTFYNMGTGLPASGTVHFSFSGRIVNTTTNQIVVPEDASVTLDANGSFSVVLPATDDPDFLPTSRFWSVSEFVDGQTRRYAVLLPASPSSVDLADIAPIDPTTPNAVYVLLPPGGAYQPLDADLTAIADGATTTAYGRAFLVLADAAAARTALALGTAATTASSAYQPVDSDLSAIAALTSAANKGLQATGAGTWALYDLTTAGKALLDDADASAQLTTLGVSTFAKTILDDADAAAARTTLGLSAPPSAATVATAEVLGAGSFVDPTTPGPAVTITTGTSALVTVTCSVSFNGVVPSMGFAISGATTRAAATTDALTVTGSGSEDFSLSRTSLVSGLTAGSNTFTAKYTGNGATFANRHIIVQAL